MSSNLNAIMPEFTDILNTVIISYHEWEEKYLQIMKLNEIKYLIFITDPSKKLAKYPWKCFPFLILLISQYWVTWQESKIPEQETLSSVQQGRIDCEFLSWKNNNSNFQ